MVTWLRGLFLLRHPEIVRDLGERRFHLLRVAEIRQSFPTARISDDIRLVAYEAGRLELGADVSIQPGTLLAFGDAQNGFGRIAVGAATWIGEYNNLRSSGEAAIQIGRGCLISQFCTLVGSNHAIAKGRPIREQGPATDRRGVVLGDDVWLGAGVTVLPGVTVGQGAVIGAGAVVTRDVPPYEIWTGVPAQRSGERT